MRIDSRERGQGITEYVLIFALVTIVILGAMYLFRNTLTGTTRRVADVVSGKSEPSEVSDGAGSTQASDTPQQQSDGDSRGSEAGAESKETGAADTESSTKEEDDSGEDEGALVTENNDGSSGGSATGTDAPRATPRGVTIVVLVVIAGVLVLVVGYFLTASSR